jgi:glycine dehydrogenase subunit 1
MMASLTGMEVSNASLYDGASAVAEASLMAVRSNRKSKSLRILVPRTVNPHYRKVAVATAGNQGLRFEDVPFVPEAGVTAVDALKKYDRSAAQGIPGSASGATRDDGEDITALVIQQPNFFGQLEDVDALTDWAHANGVLVIAVVNPTSLALLKPPGQWGSDGKGADIAVGEGQPLGVPLSSGGPYFGFMTTRLEYVRQMPGRIVGRTVDVSGRPGFTLTLQAREQHIRRAKATSNICTNQGLLMTAATIYMSLMGPVGLERTAAVSHARTQDLLSGLTSVKGLRRAFTGPFFHESVVLCDRPVGPLLSALASRGILGGLDLSELYPELGHALLVCATETKTQSDIDSYVTGLGEAMQAARAA